MLSFGFENKLQRFEFFKEVSKATRNLLPPEMRNFQDMTGPKDNWMRLEYHESLPGSSYELQFAKGSNTHTSHFGPGKKIVLAYYFEKKELLSQWKEAIQPYSARIRSQFGKEVKIAYWGKNNERNYVMIGLKLDEVELGIKPSLYSAIFSRFIMATFNPVTMATRAVGL